MLTDDEKNAVDYINHVVDHLNLFQGFDWKRLKSGTDKLVSQDGNLTILISIKERNQDKTVETQASEDKSDDDRSILELFQIL